MTIIFTVLLGVAAVLITSAIDNTSIGDTFANILAGNVAPVSSEPSSSGNTNVPGGAIGTNNSLASGAAWLNSPVTQGYGQADTGVTNTGIDFGTPFHTPITALAGGTVVSTTYSPQIGGQVLVQFQYAGQTLYAAYVHLDEIMVSVGQSINPGTEIGLSGGQLSGGAHNAQYPYSTGPHTLFGLFKQPAASFANSIDPTNFINSVKGALTI